MGWFTDLYSAPYNAITGQLTDAQKQEQVEANKAQIQSVADNAKKYYGEDSITYQIAKETADMNAAQSEKDSEAIFTANESEGCQGGLNLQGLGLGCISGLADIQRWVKYILIFGVVAGLIYVLFLIRPFISAFQGRKY